MTLFLHNATIFTQLLVHTDLKIVILSDETSFAMFSTSGRVHVQGTLREQRRSECLNPTVKGFDGSVMLYGYFFFGKVCGRLLP